MTIYLVPEDLVVMDSSACGRNTNASLEDEQLELDEELPEGGDKFEFRKAIKQHHSMNKLGDVLFKPRMYRPQCR